MTDLRVAVRSLARAPILAAAIILTIALGIGATTAVFSVVYAVIYRPLPYPEPDRLVAVWQTRPRDPTATNPEVDARVAVRAFVSDSLLRAWERQATCFETIGAYSWQRVSVTAGGQSEAVEGAVASARFFTVLGVRPRFGRLFRAEDDEVGKGEVVVLDHTYWRRRFGGDPHVVGTSILVDGAPHVVIGVLPASFHFAIQYANHVPALYTPYTHQFTPKTPFAIMPGAIARLKPGVTPAAAQAEMTTVMRRLALERRSYRGRGAFVVPLGSEAVETGGGMRKGLVILFATTACVLLIACVNVANLLLVRAGTRHRELAVRTALGAGKWRLMRLMLVESVLLALAGGALGVLLAGWGTDALLAMVPEGMFPRVDEVRVDSVVLAFGLVGATVAGLLAGLAPALYALRRDRHGKLTDTLKDSQRAGSMDRGGRTVRRTLVAAQVGLAMVLLVGAVLLARTYVSLMRVDLGVRPDHVLSFHVPFAPQSYAQPSTRTAFVGNLLARLRAMNGVKSAGVATSMPLQSWHGESARLWVDGQEQDADASVSINRVTEGFFEAAGISLASGRFFTAGDANGTSVVVSRSFARRFWPRTSDSPSDAVGRVVRVLEKTYRVVGVVGDVKYQGPKSDPGSVVYLPFLSEAPVGSASVVVRAHGDPLALLPATRAAIQSLDPNMVIDRAQSLEDVLVATVAHPRFHMAIIGAFAILALALALLGLYGVVAQSVAQRTGELGIRLALGAGQGRIAWMVVREAVLLVLFGIAAGIAISLSTTRVLSGLLFGVTFTDGVTYVVVAVAMIAVGAAASLVPARRASTIDPAEALRQC